MLVDSQTIRLSDASDAGLPGRNQTCIAWHDPSPPWFDSPAQLRITSHDLGSPLTSRRSLAIVWSGCDRSPPGTSHRLSSSKQRKRKAFRYPAHYPSQARKLLCRNPIGTWASPSAEVPRRERPEGRDAVCASGGSTSAVGAGLIALYAKQATRTTRQRVSRLGGP
jgi:hypothetical protein